jgi:glutathione synthase/RimK-type ligase-like ATP-grasp enzyme
MKLTKELLAKFTEEFQLYLYGIDIIITKDGKHLVIDCNYLSSYTNLEQETIMQAFDRLYEELLEKPVV